MVLADWDRFVRFHQRSADQPLERRVRKRWSPCARRRTSVVIQLRLANTQMVQPEELEKTQTLELEQKLLNIIDDTRIIFDFLMSYDTASTTPENL